MKLADVQQLIREVFKTPQRQIVRRNNGWVNLPCPLAKWRHEKGHDNSPSFGISYGKDTSIAHCYTCKFKHTVSTLLETYQQHSGVNLQSMIDTVRNDEYIGGLLPSWEEIGEEELHERYSVDKAIPQYAWEVYEPATGHWYLAEREIDDTTVEAMSLMVDESDSEGEERILFPMFDMEGNCYGMSGRAVNDTARIKARDYHGLDKRLFLLGLQLIKPEHQFIVLVEGLFDVARLVQYSIPVLGVLGSTLTDAQADWLIEIGKPVILMYDADKAGDEGVAVASEKLIKHVPVFTVTYPDREIYNDNSGEYELVKDPDQLLYDEVVEMIAARELCAL